MFQPRASLSAAALLTLIGLLIGGVGIFLLQDGLRLFAELGADRFTLSILGLAIVLVGAGGSLVASGLRSVEMFERKLLLTISSRGVVKE